jgi:hypothetical protein
MAVIKTDRVLHDDATMTVTESTYADGDVLVARTTRTDWKPGSVGANIDALSTALNAPVLLARVTAIRARALDIREGYGKAAPAGTNPITETPYTAITTANQQARAVQDLADGINDLSRVIANLLRDRAGGQLPPES